MTSNKTCAICGIPIQQRRTYCSIACMYEGRKRKHPHNWSGLTTNCLICGKIFHATPNVLAKGGNKYCSRICFGKGHTNTMLGRGRNRIAKVCAECGKSYEIIPSWAKGSRFCSHACSSTYKRRLTGPNHPLWKEPARHICEWCGVEYTTKPALASRTHFCSRQCQGSWTSWRFKDPSSLEVTVAQWLIDLAIPSIAQKQMGSFLCDFAIPQVRLVIECDGIYWHGSSIQQAKDRNKDNWLTSHAWHILRLTEEQIKNDPEGCKELIMSAYGLHIVK